MKYTPRTAAAALALALVSAQAVADVRYDFTALSSLPIDGYRYTGSFSVVLTDFVSDFANISAAAMLSCSSSPSPVVAGCVGAQFNPNLSGNDQIAFLARSLSPNTAYNAIYYYFADGAFAAPGTYASQVLGPSQAATLRVISLPAVPEPAAAALFISGLMALRLVHRQRASALGRALRAV
jgi:hypothetical protein